MNKSEIFENFVPDELDLRDIENIEDIEEQLEQEFITILEAKKIKKKQTDQMHDMRDNLYYACVVFCNEADKKKWLSHLTDLDIEQNTFIDGYQLAKKMGINVEMTASLPKPHFQKQMVLKDKKKL